MKITKSQLRQIIRESICRINEINASTIGSAIRKTNVLNRDRQNKNIKNNYLESLVKQYMFSGEIDGAKYSIRPTINRLFPDLVLILVQVTSGEKTQSALLNPENFIMNKLYKTIEGVDMTNTFIGYVIDNLRAGERMKLRNMISSIKEFNKGYEDAYSEGQGNALTEKAVSKSQQRFFGMVDAFKKGKLDSDEVSKSIKDAAKGMTKKQIEDFAETKHKGLPNHVKKNKK
jgi:hypothetical protein